MRAIRAAAALTLESLETRRLLSVTLVDEIHDDPVEENGLIGQFMAARDTFILAGQPHVNVDLNEDESITLDETAIGRVKLFNTDTGDIYEIANPNPDQDDAFGSAVVFLDDDTFAVTAAEGPAGDGSGQVYIYNIVSGVPTALPVATISGGGSGDLFGNTLAAIDGDVLIADRQGGPGGTSGIIYRYNANGTADVDVPTYTFGGMNDAFGQAIATNEADGHVLVAARTGGALPIAIEFDADGNQVQTYTTVDAQAGDDFFGLAFNGTRVIVGDIARDRVLDFNRLDASLVRTINNPGPNFLEANELFGAAVAINGDNLVITASADIDEDNIAFRGAAYVYSASATDDDPAPTDTILNPTHTPGAQLGAPDQFGFAIGVLGNGDVVISDPWDDASGQADAGGLYVFSLGSAPTAQLDGQGNLTVTGTGSGETIVVLGVNGLTRVMVNGVQLDSDFAATGKVVILGGGGNDTLTSDKSNTLPTEIYGGAGDDIITGGGGDDLLFGEGDNDSIFARQANDVAVGGDGNDTIFGGQGRDVLIGGDGADSIEGEQGDDVLVDGSTVHDGSPTSLASIRTIWTSASDYATRVANLSNGLLDPDSAVIDDGDADVLVGGVGQDWFLVGTGDVEDERKNEITTDL